MAFSVSFSEMHGWPKWHVRSGMFYGERKLKCNWGDQWTLAQELDTWPNNYWPYNGGLQNCLTFDIESVPFPAKITDAGAGLASYEHALLTVRYKSGGPVYINGSYIDEWFETWNEHHQVDWTKLCWDNAQGVPLRPNEAPSYTYYGGLYVLKWFQLATPPPSFLDYIGYINSNVVTCYTFSRQMAPRTLLFAGSSLHRRISASGLQRWNCTLRFLYRRDDWNQVWRNDAAVADKYQDVFVKGGDVFKKFPETNF